jgi:hypothetical protein
MKVKRKQKRTKTTDWTKVPRVELVDLKTTIQFITDTGEASLKTRGLPDRERLLWAVRLLPYAAEEVLDVATDEERERALRLALLHAFTIGSYGTRSDNTKSVGTASGRSKAAEKREPDTERIRQAIAEAEKIYPPDCHGNIKRIAKHVGVDAKTVSRYRKKMRTR